MGNEITKDLLTIVIPCKNEKTHITKAMSSIRRQLNVDENVKVVIVDGGSNDGTLEKIETYRYLLPNTMVINGNKPSIGRNNGAFFANSKYVLFLDANVSFNDPYLIYDAITYMEKKNLELVTTKLKCNNNKVVNFVYWIINIFQKLSRFTKPVCKGKFFLIRRDVFEWLEGFDEEVNFAEDYYLSKQIEGKNFRVINKKVYFDDRNFIKNGYIKMINKLLKAPFKSKN